MTNYSSNISKTIFYLLLTVLSAYSIYSIYSAWQSLYWDFPNYYVSSKLVLEGESVSQFYDNDWFKSKGEDMGFERTIQFNPFPPITAIVMLPLTPFEPLLAKRIWVSINVVLLFGIIRLLHRLFRFEYSLSAFIVLSTGLSLGLNFRLGQFYLLTVWFLLIIYSQYQKNKCLISSLLLGLITWIKYMPIIFILAFFRKKYVLYFSSAMLVILFLQWVILGTETMQAYITVLLNHLTGNIKGQGEHQIAFQSFDSLLANIFVAHPTFNPEPPINWPQGKNLGKILISVLILTVSFKSYSTFRLKNISQRTDYILILTGMTTMVLLPASAAYHYLLLLFPLSILFSHSIRKMRPNENLILLMLFALVVNTDLIPIPKLDVRILDLILSYPRLWLMTGLYFYSIHMLKQIDGPQDKRVNLSYKDLIGNKR